MTLHETTSFCSSVRVLLGAIMCQLAWICRLSARHGTEIRFSSAGFGARSMALERLSKRVEALFKSLGLPVVQAPGEAEAMCAALQRQGLVHACATKDSDVLVMGATRVYFNLHLNVSPAFDISWGLSLQQAKICLVHCKRALRTALIVESKGLVKDYDHEGLLKAILITCAWVLVRRLLRT